MDEQISGLMYFPLNLNKCPMSEWFTQHLQSPIGRLNIVVLFVYAYNLHLELAILSIWEENVWKKGKSKQAIATRWINKFLNRMFAKKTYKISFRCTNVSHGIYFLRWKLLMKQWEEKMQNKSFETCGNYYKSNSIKTEQFVSGENATDQ